MSSLTSSCPLCEVEVVRWSNFSRPDGDRGDGDFVVGDFTVYRRERGEATVEPLNNGGSVLYQGL